MFRLSIFTLILLSCTNAFALVASDVDPTNAFEQITLIVASVVSFLVFIYGAKRVLKFIGG